MPQNNREKRDRERKQEGVHCISDTWSSLKGIDQDLDAHIPIQFKLNNLEDIFIGQGTHTYWGIILFICIYIITRFINVFMKNYNILKKMPPPKKNFVKFFKIN